MVMTLSGGVDAQATVVAWSEEIGSHPRTTRQGSWAGVNLPAARLSARVFPPVLPADIPQPAGGAARNAVPLYDFPNVRVISHFIAEAPLRTSALRTLCGYANVFALQSVGDQLAAAERRRPGCIPPPARNDAP